MILAVTSLPSEIDLSESCDLAQYRMAIDLLHMVRDLCDAFKPLIKVAYD